MRSLLALLLLAIAGVTWGQLDLHLKITKPSKPHAQSELPLTLETRDGASAAHSHGAALGGGQAESSSVKRRGTEIGPVECVFGSADPDYKGVCDHIAFQKIHRTGGRTLQTLLFLLAGLQDKAIFRVIRAVSGGTKFDFVVHHTNRVDRGEFKPVYGSWSDNLGSYSSKFKIKRPFASLVPVRDPFSRFVSHVQFLHGATNFTKLDPSLYPNSTVLFRYNMLKDFQARYLGLHTKEAIDIFLGQASRDPMLWFVAERWDLSLALIARRCGIPPACMAYMPISTLVHDGKGAGPTFDLYTKIAKEHELDERLVEGVNRLLDQELKKYGLEELRRSAQCMQETQDCYIVYCTNERKLKRSAPFCRFWTLKDTDQQKLLGMDGKWEYFGPHKSFSRDAVLTEWRTVMDQCKQVTARTCGQSNDYSKWSTTGRSGGRERED